MDLEVKLMDMWNEKLTRENIEAFYYSTCEMVYSSVYGITKETTRAEQAIVKSYLDVYQQRTVIDGEDVLYVFGDILLKNAKEIVEKYPLPDNLNSSDMRALDEYTRNFMHDKILAKIDSTGFRVAEFISTDAKKPKAAQTMKKFSDYLPITPALLVQLVIVFLLIWGISYVAVTFPYRSDPLIDSDDVFTSVPLVDKFVQALPYYPLNVDFPVEEAQATDPDASETTVSEETTSLGPVIASSEPSATMG